MKAPVSLALVGAAILAIAAPAAPALAQAAGARVAAAGARAADSLPSWNDTGSRQAIVAFVERVTRTGSPDFVPAGGRIAVFDNDGTLWSEQPVYVQLAFALDRLKVLAPQHPEWQDQEPYKSALAGDFKTLAASGQRGLVELVMATHAGTTTDEFETIVNDWLATAKHPRTGRPYTEMIFQPMVELLAYLRAHGFKTYIVSGGGVEFMRPWAERVYGVPPEQVIGSSIEARYEVRDGRPVITRLPSVDFIDDKDGKPVAIQKFIGRTPILAFGNSDGDFQMLEWTTSTPGARLGLLVHHDDARREVAYDRESSVGRLARGLDEGAARGWTIVSMKSDWRRVFSFEK